MELVDSKILITGGSSGIGKMTAKLLVKVGARVAITGRNKDRLLEASKETGAFPIVADVSEPGDIDFTFKEALKYLNGLDCLINNAGIGWSIPVTEVTLKDLQKIYAVNVFGPALMARKAAAIFIEQKHGHIINIGSTASHEGYAGGTVYASSKFALRGMTECWRSELSQYNIRVMLINPSEKTTVFGFFDREKTDMESKNLRSEEIAHAIISALEMNDSDFTSELSVWATNPW